MTDLIVDEQPDGTYLVRVESRTLFVEFSLSEDELQRFREALE